MSVSVPPNWSELRSAIDQASQAARVAALSPRYPLVSQLAPLGALPTAPGCARAHVRSTLARWEMSAYEEVAELLISEMVTNAVEASTDDSGQPIYVGDRMPVVVVRLVAIEDGLVLEVWDVMPTVPVLQQTSTWDDRGRGLLLLQALAHRWNWTTVPDWPGKCVWAELRSSSLPAV